MISELTCAPSPPPICSIVNGTEVCLAPPLQCVQSCSGDVCTVTCCAAFAPAPVPASSPVMLLLMATVVVIAAYRRISFPYDPYYDKAIDIPGLRV